MTVRHNMGALRGYEVSPACIKAFKEETPNLPHISVTHFNNQRLQGMPFSLCSCRRQATGIYFALVIYVNTYKCQRLKIIKYGVAYKPIEAGPEYFVNC